MTLPTASDFEVYLNGWADAPYCLGAKYSEMQTLGVIHFAVIQWLRAHNDAAALACPNLPDLERRYSDAHTLDAKREALRALLAARDTVVANAARHAAVQATAVKPLQLGLHPTGVGGEG